MDLGNPLDLRRSQSGTGHQLLDNFLAHAALDTYVLFGKAPWTLRHHADHTQLRKAADAPKIDYPKPDGILSFDKLSSVFISNTNHEEDQPVHLKLTDPALPITVNLVDFDEALVSYSRWYTNNVGDNPGTDYWTVDVTANGGETWSNLENTNESQDQWIQKTYLLSNFIEFSDDIQFRFVAEDVNNPGDSGTGGSIVEAAIDDFSISIFKEVKKWKIQKAFR